MFKKFSPFHFSLMVTLIVIILGVLSAIFIPRLISHTLYLILFLVCMVGILIFLIRFLTGKMVLDKLEMLYHTVHNPMVEIESKKDRLSQHDMIEKVTEDVKQWAADKALEISQLKQMEKYRREFLGNVSHELKTPIFNIQGYILTLLEGGIDDPTINTLYLQRAEKSINRMISIVEDLESISRLESDTFTLKITRFDVILLAEEVMENHEMMARKKGISLAINKPIQGKSHWVKADRQRILEALSNLVTNSILYGKTKGKTTISFRDMGAQLRVIVTDNGTGIPEKDLPRIFERFYRVAESRTYNQRGTGLGLAIVKHIIEAHNQKIEVQSRWHEGSQFSFTLEKG